jgi:hypothetical protein
VARRECARFSGVHLLQQPVRDEHAADVSRFFIPTCIFLPLPSGKGIPERYKWYTVSYRSNSNSKPKSCGTPAVTTVTAVYLAVTDGKKTLDVSAVGRQPWRRARHGRYSDLSILIKRAKRETCG